MEPAWCPVCCTSHAPGARCPGELQATGPERPCWRVNAHTAQGLEAWGVLLAPCGGTWRARIMTHPNVLWRAPGTSGSMKFVGRTPAEATDRAVAFIRRHCDERGYQLSAARPLAQSASGKPSPRKVRFLPVRFGVVRPAEPAGTGNLSETGLYVITPSPLDAGAPLRLMLRADTRSIDLRGQVIWMNKEHRAGRVPGMGIALTAPPASYLGYVRALP